MGNESKGWGPVELVSNIAVEHGIHAQNAESAGLLSPTSEHLTPLLGILREILRLISTHDRLSSSHVPALQHGQCAGVFPPKKYLGLSRT